MQFALSDDRQRVEAFPAGRAWCPGCGAEVLAKCGAIMTHHWAHAKGCDCDSWFEPETEWHRAWKSLAPPDRVEVIMGPHRADIVSRSNWVCELQNSHISPELIREREIYYGEMIWLVNAETFADHLHLLGGDGKRFTLQWLWQRPSWRFARKPIYLDLNSVRVADLLSQPLTVGGTAGRKLWKRYERTPGRATHFETEVMDSTMLRIRKLGQYGNGIVDAVSRERFISEIG